MNKRLFKRLLIVSGLIAPVAMITPMILTSCNDNTNTNTPSDDKNTISLGNFNNLLKVKNPDSENAYFWLDVVDFHGGSFNGFNQIKTFYDSLVKNKKTLIDDLITNQKFIFNETDTNKANQGKPTNYFANQLVLTKNTYDIKNDVENLKTVFKDLLLSNIFDVENDISKPGKGITINGTDLNFSDILSKANIDSKITFIDELIDTKDDINAVRKKNRYQIVYKIQPKNDFIWKGVDNKYKDIPLVITLNDNVNDISIIDELNNIKVTTTNQVDEIVLNVSATVADTRDNVVNTLKDKIGVDVTTDINNGTATTNKIEKITEFFTLLKDQTYQVKIEGENKSGASEKIDVTSNFLSKEEMFNNDLTKQRLDFYVRSGKKDTTNTKLITIDAVIDIKKNANNNNIYNFNWFGGVASEKNLNAPIVMKFQITTN